ncbi:MAG: uncharacterized protein KVP18_001655 [Porospora cf. gigantea A]|uniref:uncharacterized protein n=1 Tax=Porospora cf. gigantea A TaxID=2853593 RepID=UPI00355A8FEF|nr:MAG: hypothetical protein KVP18_001655 [Porospora cf. gigantea A]
MIWSQPGQFNWILNSKTGFWEVCRVTDSGVGQGLVEVKGVDGIRRVVPQHACRPVDPTLSAQLGDVPTPDPESLALHISNRFERGRPFTSVGDQTVLSAHSYRFLDLFALDAVQCYATSALVGLEPHVYLITRQAVDVCVHEEVDQFVFFTGPHGSNPNFNCLQALQFAVFYKSRGDDTRMRFAATKIDAVYRIIKGLQLSFSDDTFDSLTGLHCRLGLCKQGLIKGLRLRLMLTDWANMSSVFRAEKEPLPNIVYHVLHGFTQQLPFLSGVALDVCDAEAALQFLPSCAITDSELHAEALSKFCQSCCQLSVPVDDVMALLRLIVSSALLDAVRRAQAYGCLEELQAKMASTNVFLTICRVLGLPSEYELLQLWNQDKNSFANLSITLFASAILRLFQAVEPALTNLGTSPEPVPSEMFRTRFGRSGDGGAFMAETFGAPDSSPDESLSSGSSSDDEAMVNSTRKGKPKEWTETEPQDQVQEDGDPIQEDGVSLNLVAVPGYSRLPRKRMQSLPSLLKSFALSHIHALFYYAIIQQIDMYRAEGFTPPEVDPHSNPFLTLDILDDPQRGILTMYEDLQQSTANPPPRRLMRREPTQRAWQAARDTQPDENEEESSVQFLHDSAHGSTRKANGDSNKAQIPRLDMYKAKRKPQKPVRAPTEEAIPPSTRTQHLVDVWRRFQDAHKDTQEVRFVEGSQGMDFEFEHSFGVVQGYDFKSFQDAGTMLRQPPDAQRMLIQSDIQSHYGFSLPAELVGRLPVPLETTDFIREYLYLPATHQYDLYVPAITQQDVLRFAPVSSDLPGDAIEARNLAAFDPLTFAHFQNNDWPNLYLQNFEAVLSQVKMDAMWFVLGVVPGEEVSHGQFDIEFLQNQLSGWNIHVLLQLLGRGWPQGLPFESFAGTFSVLLPSTESEAEREAQRALVTAPTIRDRCLILLQLLGVPEEAYRLGESRVMLTNEAYDVLCSCLGQQTEELALFSRCGFRALVASLPERRLKNKLANGVLRMQSRLRSIRSLAQFERERSLYDIFTGMSLLLAYLARVRGSDVTYKRKIHEDEKRVRYVIQLQHEAASAIQRWWRGVASQLELGRRRLRRMRQCAATVLCMAGWRYLAISELRRQQEAPPSTAVAAAVAIQSAWRGYYHWRFYSTLASLRSLVVIVQKRVHAALLLKCLPVRDRSLPTRGILRHNAFRQDAAVIIQKHFKRFWCRKQFLELVRTADRLAAWAQAKVKRARFQRHRDAAMIVQRWWRGRQALAATELPTAPAIPRRVRPNMLRSINEIDTRFLEPLNKCLRCAGGFYHSKTLSAMQVIANDQLQALPGGWGLVRTLVDRIRRILPSVAVQADDTTRLLSWLITAAPLDLEALRRNPPCMKLLRLGCGLNHACSLIGLLRPHSDPLQRPCLQTLLIPWGSNGLCQQGRQTPGILSLGLQVPITDVQCGSDTTIALTAEGALFAWGDNTFGQCGTGPLQRLVPAPTQVALSAVSLLSVGLHHSLAVADAVYTWGHSGFVGMPGEYFTPQKVPLGNYKAQAILAAWSASLVVSQNRRVVVWGRNHKGQAGCGRGPLLRPRVTQVWQDVPLQVTKLVAGLHCVVALCGGVAFCWGEMKDSVLGSVILPRPTQVLVDDVDDVACGNCKVYFLVKGQVVCFTQGTFQQADGSRPNIDFRTLYGTWLSEESELRLVPELEDTETEGTATALYSAMSPSQWCVYGTISP